MSEADLDPLEERRFQREREARKIAESQLEDQSLELYLAQIKLEQHYAQTIEVFASLMSGRSGRPRASLRQLARRVKIFARALNLNEQEINDLHLAAMLCDVGKLTLSDEILITPVFEMNKDQFSVFSKHPRLAYEALITLEPLGSVAAIVRDHAEQFDGSGYPAGKHWEEVSVSARILCMEKDHDAMLNGILTPKAATEAGARRFVLDHRGSRYDPEMVDLWISIQGRFDIDQDAAEEMALHPLALSAGMTLTRDLTSQGGVLMLGAGKVLTQHLIEKLLELEISASNEFVLYVVPAPKREPGEKSYKDQC